MSTGLGGKVVSKIELEISENFPSNFLESPDLSGINRISMIIHQYTNFSKRWSVALGISGNYFKVDPFINVFWIL